MKLKFIAFQEFSFRSFLLSFYNIFHCFLMLQVFAKSSLKKKTKLLPRHFNGSLPLSHLFVSLLLSPTETKGCCFHHFSNTRVINGKYIKLTGNGKTLLFKDWAIFISVLMQILEQRRLDSNIYEYQSSNTRLKKSIVIYFTYKQKVSIDRKGASYLSKN